MHCCLFCSCQFCFYTDLTEEIGGNQYYLCTQNKRLGYFFQPKCEVEPVGPFVWVISRELGCGRFMCGWVVTEVATLATLKMGHSRWSLILQE